MKLPAAHPSPPRVGATFRPTSLLHLRKAGDEILALIRSGTEVQLWRIATADFPGVALLSAHERAQVEGAVRTLHRDLEAGK